MNLSFKDKVTLVTGAASGMGLAAVQAFAAEFGRNSRLESVSVALEEIKSEDWVDKVFRPDIKNKSDSLYKKPGYDERDM